MTHGVRFMAGNSKGRLTFMEPATLAKVCLLVAHPSYLLTYNLQFHTCSATRSRSLATLMLIDTDTAWYHACRDHKHKMIALQCNVYMNVEL